MLLCWLVVSLWTARCMQTKDRFPIAEVCTRSPRTWLHSGSWLPSCFLDWTITDGFTVCHGLVWQSCGEKTRPMDSNHIFTIKIAIDCHWNLRCKSEIVGRTHIIFEPRDPIPNHGCGGSGDVFRSSGSWAHLLGLLGSAPRHWERQASSDHSFSSQSSQCSSQSFHSFGRRCPLCWLLCWVLCWVLCWPCWPCWPYWAPDIPRLLEPFQVVLLLVFQFWPLPLFILPLPLPQPLLLGSPFMYSPSS